MIISKFAKIVLLLVTIAPIVIGVSAMTNPLRKSEESIRQQLLQEMPMGSDREEVRVIIENNEWEVGFDRDIGYKDFGGFGVNGTKSINAIIGQYYEIPIPLTTFVEVFWGFDEDDKLVDIALRKMTDGP